MIFFNKHFGSQLTYTVETWEEGHYLLRVYWATDVEVTSGEYKTLLEASNDASDLMRQLHLRFGDGDGHYFPGDMSGEDDEQDWGLGPLYGGEGGP